jgi:hypothetical protein
MTDPLALGEQLLSLLEESARSSTYKPVLLLALIDRVQDHGGQAAIPVRALAERVIELDWPQTLPYQTTGQVLRQSQSGRGTGPQSSLRSSHSASSTRAPTERSRSSFAATRQKGRNPRQLQGSRPLQPLTTGGTSDYFHRPWHRQETSRDRKRHGIDEGAGQLRPRVVSRARIGGRASVRGGDDARGGPRPARD